MGGRPFFYTTWQVSDVGSDAKSIDSKSRKNSLVGEQRRVVFKTFKNPQNVCAVHMSRRE